MWVTTSKPNLFIKGAALFVRRPFFICVLTSVSVIAFLTSPAVVNPQDQTATDPTRFTLQEKEEFLQNGKIVSEKFLSVGVTHSLRVTLEYNGMTHDAHVQSIDEKMPSTRTGRGSDPQFRDYYAFNVAAYDLDKLLGLNMTPASVKRKIRGKWAAFTWWVDNVAMMNLDRVRKDIQPPDTNDWDKQLYIVRIMNQLVYDTDPNMGNLLITKDWKLWTVDRTRAFRPYEKLENPKNLSKCERNLLSRLRELNKNMLQEKLQEYLTNPEIEGLDARRRLIVKFFDEEIATKGEASVLYDLPSRN